MQKLLEDQARIDREIAATKQAYAGSINEIGQELGTVAPLIQGEQAYQERKGQIALQYLNDQKTNAVETYNRLKEYRKDQTDAIATLLKTFSDNGLNPDQLSSGSIAMIDR